MPMLSARSAWTARRPATLQRGQQRLATTGVAGAVAAVMTRQPPLNVLLQLPRPAQ